MDEHRKVRKFGLDHAENMDRHQPAADKYHQWSKTIKEDFDQQVKNNKFDWQQLEVFIQRRCLTAKRTS